MHSRVKLGEQLPHNTIVRRLLFVQVGHLTAVLFKDGTGRRRDALPFPFR